MMKELLAANMSEAVAGYTRAMLRHILDHVLALDEAEVERYHLLRLPPLPEKPVPKFYGKVQIPPSIR
jgi:hypothetical protein